MLIFAGLSRLILRDRRVALLATLAFAASGGIAVHSRILRSELVAACPVIFALMILIFVARRGRLWRPLLIALAAGLCVIGLENKVQAILLIAALPIVILPFGLAVRFFCDSLHAKKRPTSWFDHPPLPNTLEEARRQG